MCGVFGIRSVDRDVARLTSTSPSSRCSTAGRSRPDRRLGGWPVDGACVTWGSSPRCSTSSCRRFPGEVAIGHTRYSTTGGVHWSNAQPLVHHGRARTVALGHNGNLTNAGVLRDELVADGIRLGRHRIPR